MEYRPDPLTTVRSHPTGEAFSLIELLVVVAIIALVYVFTVPAIESMLTGYRIGAAGDMVVGVLGSARQSALSLNQTVEVRFYLYAINGLPGEQPLNPGTGKYRAVQVFAYDANGTAMPITKAQQLPDGTIFDSGTLSPILSGTAQQKVFTASDPQVPIPEVSGTAYKCAAYQIYPGGTTTMAGQEYVTIHRNLDGDPLASLPKNYIIVQVDPVSATVRSYKP